MVTSKSQQFLNENPIHMKFTSFYKKLGIVSFVLFATVLFSCKDKDKPTVDPVNDFSGIYKGTLVITEYFGTLPSLNQEQEVVENNEIAIVAAESGYILKELDSFDVITDSNLAILGQDSMHKDVVNGGGAVTDRQLAIDMHRNYSYTTEELHDSLIAKRSLRFI
jgi:hypothetical protein